MSQTRPPVRQIDDPDVLRALAHPLRRRLWRILLHGPATVGTLATSTGSDPGQVSYHLRELARGKWVQRAPELARDRRESWWRAALETTSWGPNDFDTPADQALERHVSIQLINEDLQRLRRFLGSAEEWDQPWRDVAVVSRAFLLLTPEEAKTMLTELAALLERWGAVGDASRQTGDLAGRTPYLLLLNGFPERPGEP